MLIAIQSHGDHLRVDPKNPPTLIYFDAPKLNAAKRAPEGENSPALAEALLRGAGKIMKQVVADYERAMEAEHG